MPVQVLFANGTDRLFGEADSAEAIAESIVLVKWNQRLHSLEAINAFPWDQVTSAEVLDGTGAVERLVLGRGRYSV